MKFWRDKIDVCIQWLDIKQSSNIQQWKRSAIA
jgi:hypothetical protein